MDTKGKQAFMTARLMTSMMPEQIVVDEAIKALQDYREKKFGSTEVRPEADTKQSLKDFLADGENQPEINEDIKPPMAQLTMTLVKWSDKDMGMQDILKDMTSE